MTQQRFPERSHLKKGSRVFLGAKASSYQKGHKHESGISRSPSVKYRAIMTYRKITNETLKVRDCYKKKGMHTSTLVFCIDGLPLLARSVDVILQVIQRQSTIHVSTIIFPCDTKPHTFQALPFAAEGRRIHLEIFHVVSWVQPRKRNNTLNDTTAWLPAPDADSAFGLRDSGDAGVRKGMEVECLLWRAISDVSVVGT